MQLQMIRERWNVFLAVATAICTAIAGFLELPQIGINFLVWSKFGTFSVALLIGLWLVPMRTYAVRRYLPLWVCCSILLFAGSIVLFSHFTNAINQWTFAYPTDDSEMHIVAGTTLSPDSDRQREDGARQGHAVPDRELLWNAGGQIGDVWPVDQERIDRADQLTEVYLVELLLLASTIITVVQASYCAGLKKTTRRTS